LLETTSVHYFSERGFGTKKRIGKSKKGGKEKRYGQKNPRWENLEEKIKAVRPGGGVTQKEEGVLKRGAGMKKPQPQKPDDTSSPKPLGVDPANAWMGGKGESLKHTLRRGRKIWKTGIVQKKKPGEAS